jgi:predicted nucleic acid-binding protein
VLSVALALEYEAICLQPEHLLAAGLNAGEAQVFTDGLISAAEPTRIYFRWRPQLRDPGDEMVLETAVNGRVNAIVTFNERDFRDVPARFGIAVIRPGDALRRITP